MDPLSCSEALQRLVRELYRLNGLRLRGSTWFFHHRTVVDFVDGAAPFASQEVQCLCGSEGWSVG